MDSAWNGAIPGFYTDTDPWYQQISFEHLTRGDYIQDRYQVIRKGNYYCPTEVLTNFTLACMGGRVIRTQPCGLPNELLDRLSKDVFKDPTDNYKAPGDLIDYLVNLRKLQGKSIRRKNLIPLRDIEPYYQRGFPISVYINHKPTNWYPGTAYVLEYPRDVDIDLRYASFIHCPSEVSPMFPHIIDKWIDQHFNLTTWTDSIKFIDYTTVTKSAHLVKSEFTKSIVASDGTILPPFEFLQNLINTSDGEWHDEYIEPDFGLIDWDLIDADSDDDSD